MSFDISVLFTPEALISLVTLIFLEILLGVDNIVFIVLTTSKLPANLQKLGRKLGLAGAMVMRIIFLSFASYLVHMVAPLFTIDIGFYNHGFAMRDLVLFIGGIYLIYKGISELHSIFSLKDLQDEGLEAGAAQKKTIGLAQAVGTIMVMDIVFSIDSVITAVGLANQLIIMILAVIIAIIVMMTFIDPISEFINAHVEMKILAVIFIATIGILLSLDGAGITTGMEVLDMSMEKLLVYFGMLFSLAIEMLLIWYRGKLDKYKASLNENKTKEGIADQLTSEIG